MDDSFAKLSWVAPPCNNQGKYVYEELWKKQCQSYEFDFYAENAVDKPQFVDALVQKNRPLEQPVDSIVEAAIELSYENDVLTAGEQTKIYRVDRTLEGETTKNEPVDCLLSKDLPKEDSVDAILEKNIRRIYKVDIGLHDKNSWSYLVDMKLAKSGLIPRLVRIERFSPQFLDLWLPEIPYTPYNSAWEFVE